MQWQPLPPELWPFPHFLCYLLRELNLVDTPTRRQLEMERGTRLVTCSSRPRDTLTCSAQWLNRTRPYFSGALFALRLEPGPGVDRIPSGPFSTPSLPSASAVRLQGGCLVLKKHSFGRFSE